MILSKSPKSVSNTPGSNFWRRKVFERAIITYWLLSGDAVLAQIRKNIMHQNCICKANQTRDNSSFKNFSATKLDPYFIWLLSFWHWKFSLNDTKVENLFQIFEKRLFLNRWELVINDRKYYYVSPWNSYMN